MGIIYGGVYIGPVSRHHMDYTRVTRATCVLKLFMVTSHDVLLATYKLLAPIDWILGRKYMGDWWIS